MILYDLTSIQAQIGVIKFHGGGKYGEMVFRHMVKKEIQVSAYYDSRRYITPEIIELCRDKEIKLYDISTESLVEIVNSGNYNLVYSPLDGAGFEDLNIKKIITIHGLRNFETPTDKTRFKYKYSWNRWYKEKLKHLLPNLFLKRERNRLTNKYFSDINTDIVTVSHHSRNSMLTYFPILSERKAQINVFYSPNTSIAEPSVKVDGIVSQKYFLIVSGNRWVKNGYRAIKAFELLRSLGYYQDMKLVIAGATESSFSVKFANPECLDFRGYVDDGDLEYLYKNAYALLYPSLNEGFGYPPMEAMKYGTPVIASPFTSIPEVCGGAVLYANPLSVEEIATRMLQISDDSLRQKLKTDAIERFKMIKAKQDLDLDKLVDFLAQQSDVK